MSGAPVPASGAALVGQAYRREHRRVAAGVVGLSLHQLCEAMVPVAIGLIIDHAVVPRDERALGVGLVGLSVLFTVLMLAYRTGARILYVAVQRESHRLRVRVVAHLLHPRGTRTRLRSGELLSIASTDADLTGMTLRLAGFAAGGAVAVAVSAVVLLRIDLLLGIGVLVGVPAIVGLLQLLAPWMTRRSAAQQEAIGHTTAMATDLVRGVRVLRGIGAEANALRRYERASQDSLAAAMSAARWRGVLLGASEIASGLFLTAVAGTAGWFALAGRISVGEFVTVIGLAQFVAEPVRTLGGVAEDIATYRASADRVARVLNAPLVADEGDRVAPARRGASLDSVSYGSLRGVDLEFSPGELVGVVCYDARDADALVELLTGRVDANELTGAVFVGGVPASEATHNSVRTAMLVEPHDVALLEGTLEENLRLGTAAAASSDLDAALVAASADEVVTSHPDGLQRRLTERGAGLSGGQRQRIAIARSLMAAPGVLVLHDPTTAVDAVTEEAIARGLSAVRHGVEGRPDNTTVVVTRSPALLAHADRVLVIGAGRVITGGMHGDLLASDEAYRTAVTR